MRTAREWKVRKKCDTEKGQRKTWPAHVNINHQRIISLFKGAQNGSPEETGKKSNREDNRLMGRFTSDALGQAFTAKQDC